MKPTYIAGTIITLCALGYMFWPTAQQSDQNMPLANSSDAAMVEVTLPDAFSANAQVGQQVFDAKCAMCHAVNADGREGVAPPLVHKIYEPGHHGDESFQLAAAIGVRAHHWSFGNMPPVEGITRGDVAMIIEYVRELQRANGIN